MARLFPRISPLGRLVARRLAFAAFSLLVVATIVFWAIDFLPGDAAQRILGRDATPEALDALRMRLQLNDPALLRYVRWLADLIQGDLGSSLAADRPVLPYVAGHLANTLLLASAALAIHIPLSIGLGLVAASSRRDGIADTLIAAFVLLGMSVPEFVIGIGLVTWLSTAWNWFPPLALIDQAHSIGQLASVLALPVLTLNCLMTAYVVRQTRSSMIEIMQSDFVRAAMLRGLPRSRVLLRHALPSAVGPAVNAIALNAGWLIGGIVVVEAVFNYPGLGRLLVEAIGNRDVPMVQGAAMALSAAYIVINLIADVVTALFNPKQRTALA